MDPTVVLFPAGATHARARVLQARELADRWAVVTDITPFHPLDHSWPDQPGDRGTLEGVPVIECLTGAIGPDGELRLGADIPVRRGEPGWTWVVVHVLPGDSPPPLVGQEVALEVDQAYRSALSAAHSACHLAALALNAAAAPLWRKDPGRPDSLGSPDLDALAIAVSRIEPGRSVDEYRLGKSIRKKGLDTEALLAGLEGLAAAATAQVQAWIATGAAVHIDTGGDSSVAARRQWVCDLPEGGATYPCGGTHVASLAELPPTTHVAYRPTEDGFAADTLVE